MRCLYVCYNVKKYYLLYILPALLLFSACTTTKKVYLQVLMPAERNITHEVLNITLLDRSNAVDGEANVVSETAFRQADELDSLASARFMLGLRDVLDASPRFAVLSQQSLTERRNNVRLTSTSVNNICDTIGCDGIISLDDLNMTIDILFNGSLGYMIVETNLNIRFYSVYNAYIQDSYTYTDTMYWDSYIVSSNDIDVDFPSSEAAVSEAAYLAGWNYGTRIAPAWVEESRILVTGSGKKFEQAYSLFIEDRTDEAISIWEEIATTSSGRKAANAYLNIAVANEMRDELDVALQNANKSYFELSREGVKMYVNYLRDRIEKKEKLQQQLPF